MRYLILSDIHANLPAFEAVLADAKTVGYDQVLVLGDLVGYGADPGAVIDLTLALSPVAMIRGNHDKVCAGLESSELFNDVARASVDWTQSVLTPAQHQMLAALPRGPHLVSDQAEICHGTPFDEDYYLFDADDAERAFASSTGRICLFGHTHVPAAYLASPPDDFGEVVDDTLKLPLRGRALVNVGSVGQPRDGDPRAAYGILDLNANVIHLRRVTYDLEDAQRRILDAGLPHYLALRLARGQ